MTTFVDWLRHDTAGLLTLAAVSIAVLLLLIIKMKVEPFIALIVVSVAVALTAGIPVAELVGTPAKSGDSLLETGFGGILGHITVIIGLGTVLGAMLERSGGADVLTTRLLNLFGPKGAPLAMGITGVILGIPVFFDIGIFILAPLVYVAAKRGGRSLVLYALPMLAGLSMTHAFLPPHPGPVAAAGLLGVSLGWIIIMGLACGIPAWFVSGVVWGAWIGKRVHVEVPEEFVPEEDEADTASPPSLLLVGFIIVAPMLLILAATLADVLLDGGRLLSVLTLIGNPAIALTIAVMLALYLLGIRRGITAPELAKISGVSLRPVGMILLVVGAGAFFGAVLRATGIGDALADSMTAIGLPVIVSAYLISCALRIAQGSATVAIVTTAGIIQASVADGHHSPAQIALIVVAVSAGSIIASHVNDGGFWIVSRYFNMSVKDTLKTWTVLETILSVVGFAMAGLLWLVV
ncbi:gluconate:H+ symporter [Mycolicibacterium smegmatis]|uniref:Inner membrane permease YgbN n=1 Tax=Mycolicibacterium smegmatis (strain MKD8) TaxID=1214915 RepID=A0A2U9PSN7_MYCSE|nr:gluconate:H+ symporter [Mycolicibacterium smegmatis]AWT54748.1 inner membrane permease YgbN [Mycolicibacterium smegmatis MKD8]MDF1899617.1 gluconate:H+ symporter [Mycolicibacterium smegmatis]MDF1905076.1 gluconate:H+ symporter [Mycolicibacterium smegmatis]MDF1918936.1 gluconate:H+ symporter [Mycolicibacterium smegmatis]MDF1924094.1 gluconate:H+ symporter [Mycolicibacterium smegmatis]